MPFRMKFRNLTYCDQHVTTGTVTGVPSMIPKNEGSTNFVLDSSNNIIEIWEWTTTLAAENAGVTKAIPDGSWLYAYQFKTGAAATNRTNYLSLGNKGLGTGFASVLPAITGVANTVLQLKQYVYKGGLFVPTTKDIASLGGSFAVSSIPNHATFYASPVTQATVTFPTSWATNAIYMQVLTTPNKQW